MTVLRVYYTYFTSVLQLFYACNTITVLCVYFNCSMIVLQLFYICSTYCSTYFVLLTVLHLYFLLLTTSVLQLFCICITTVLHNYVLHTVLRLCYNCFTYCATTVLHPYNSCASSELLGKLFICFFTILLIPWIVTYTLSCNVIW